MPSDPAPSYFNYILGLLLMGIGAVTVVVGLKADSVLATILVCLLGAFVFMVGASGIGMELDKRDKQGRP